MYTEMNKYDGSGRIYLSEEEMKILKENGEVEAIVDGWVHFKIVTKRIKPKSKVITNE